VGTIEEMGHNDSILIFLVRILSYYETFRVCVGDTYTMLIVTNTEVCVRLSQFEVKYFLGNLTQGQKIISLRDETTLKAPPDE